MGESLLFFELKIDKSSWDDKQEKKMENRMKWEKLKLFLFITQSSGTDWCLAISKPV